MSPEILDNPKSARIRRAAGLARKKDRLREGRFLVEGPQCVRELLAHRPELAETVFAGLDAPDSTVSIERLASDAGVPFERATPEVLRTLAETVHPQGVVAVAKIEQIGLADALRGARLVAVLHEVRDPGNAGAVLRAADAAGADAVVFSGESIDPWHPKVVRSTTGSLFHLPVVVSRGLEETVAAAREAGLRVLAADVNGAELSPADPALTGPMAWVFGNEARGLAEADRELADGVLRLPIFGAAESLNLATAASVLLYQSAFAARSSPEE